MASPAGMTLSDCPLQKKIETLRQNMDRPLTIPYLDEEISYQEFFQKYLLPNTPCILGPFATTGWRSRVEWVNDEGCPNLVYMEKEYGDAVIPVANCQEERYSSHPKCDMTLTEYLTYYKNFDISVENSVCKYLKDWHFVRDFPEANIYHTPEYFQSDWLNEYWDKREDSDDYRFVYIGPKGSWTPFHSDVLRSYSWSANICGRKKWIIYPPGEEKNLIDKFGQLAFDVTSPVLKDKDKYPNVDRKAKVYEVIQEAGEVIFIPSGWHHQVHNLENTVSLNHNWLNGCNIDLSWNFLKDSYKEVEKEIENCREMMNEQEWVERCQLILKASSGIDYSEFYTFLLTIAIPRLESLKEQKDKWYTGITQDFEVGISTKTQQGLFRHYVFDLTRIGEIMKDMIGDLNFRQIDWCNLQTNPKQLLEDITSILQKIQH